MLLQFSNMGNHCSCSFRSFGPVFLQISKKWTIVLAVFEHGGTSLLAVFERSKTATTLVGPVFLQFSNNPGLFENCNNTSGPVFLQFSNMGGPVFLQFSNARKLQQHWWTSLLAVFEHTRFVRKLQQHWWTSLLAVFEHPGLGGPVFLQFSNIRGCGDQSSCSFRTSRAVGTSLLAVFEDPGLGGPVFLQFSNIPGWGDQSSCSFRTSGGCGDQSSCNFRTSGAVGTSLLAVFERPGAGLLCLGPLGAKRAKSAITFKFPLVEKC